MLKAVGFVIKFFVFSLLILAAGNWLRWDGKTLSDQVRSHLSHAESSDVADQIRGWTRKITDDARVGAEKRQSKPARPHGSLKTGTLHAEASVSNASEEGNPNEKIPSSERQKLKALIRELNGSH